MKKLIILLISVGCLCACRKLPNPDPSFTASLPKLTFNVGDTVNFVLSGNPDILTFYSGEVGHNYLYASRLYSPSKVNLALATTTTSVSTGANANALHLMATTDSLVLDSTSVVNAHWTDITSRATLATGSTAVTTNVDLTDFAATGHPVTLGLQYVTVSTDIQPTWNVTAFTVTTVDPTRPAASNALITSATASVLWYPVHVRSTPTVVSTPWTVFATTASITTSAINTPSRNDWLVAAPLYPNRVSADIPNSTIKSVPVTNPVTAFSYIYTAAGTYTATFVGTNVVAGEAPKVITQQFTITVQ